MSDCDLRSINNYIHIILICQLISSDYWLINEEEDNPFFTYHLAIANFI